MAVAPSHSKILAYFLVAVLVRSAARRFKDKSLSGAFQQSSVSATESSDDEYSEEEEQGTSCCCKPLGIGEESHCVEAGQSVVQDGSEQLCCKAFDGDCRRASWPGDGPTMSSAMSDATGFDSTPPKQSVISSMKAIFKWKKKSKRPVTTTTTTSNGAPPEPKRHDFCGLPTKPALLPPKSPYCFRCMQAASNESWARKFAHGRCPGEPKPSEPDDPYSWMGLGVGGGSIPASEMHPSHSRGQGKIRLESFTEHCYGLYKIDCEVTPGCEWGVIECRGKNDFAANEAVCSSLGSRCTKVVVDCDSGRSYS